MAEEKKPQRRLTVTIQALGEKLGAKGPYAVITTPPRPDMRYPDNWNAFDLSLIKGLKVGDTVVLVLERGNAKKDGSGYYENVVGIERPGGQESGQEKTGAQPEPKPEAVDKRVDKAPLAGIGTKPSSEALPWHRFVAWGEVVEQALKMVAATLSLGEGEVAPENQRAEYAKRFEWAMSLICQAIRKQMKES